MPRKIRTPAELDALPEGLVVTSPGVRVAAKRADGKWDAAGAIDSETVVSCAHGYLSLVGDLSADERDRARIVQHGPQGEDGRQ